MENSHKETVEVVRCEFCAEWNPARVFNNERGACNVDAMVREKDFFCKNGHEPEPVDNSVVPVTVTVPEPENNQDDVSGKDE